MEDFIKDKLERIEKLSLLSAKNVLTIEDVAVLMGVSTSYVYQLTHRKQIPFYKPNGKCIYFNKKEVEKWLCRNRVPSESEIAERANKYVLTH